MKPLHYLLACLFMVCITILIFALMNQGTFASSPSEAAVRRWRLSLPVPASKALPGGVSSPGLPGAEVLTHPILLPFRVFISPYALNIHITKRHYLIYKPTQCNKLNENYIGIFILILIRDDYDKRRVLKTFCLKPTRGTERRKPRAIFLLTRGYPSTPHKLRLAAYSPKGKE